MSYAKGTKKHMSLAGVEQEYTYLGQGHFNTVWKGADGLVYYVGRPSREGNDMSKDVFQWAHREGLPEYENLGFASDDYHDNRRVYRSPCYTPINAKDNPKHWEIVKALSNIWEEERRDLGNELRWQGGQFNAAFHGLDLCQRFANACKEDARVPESISETVQELVYVSSNIGTDAFFEFKKSAFAVDENDTLVFRDVVFQATAVR